MMTRAGLVYLIILMIKSPLPAQFTQLGDSLEMFMPGHISTGSYERDLTISPDGAQLCYTLLSGLGSKMTIVVAQIKNGKITQRRVAAFSGAYNDLEPFFNADGSRLYFCSNRPLNAEDKSADYNLWYVNITNGIWSPPVALPPAINTDKDEFYPSVARLGHVYFTRENERGDEDIFVSRYIQGEFVPSEPLSDSINTPAGEFNAFVSPEEDVIIFSSVRPGNIGRGDLYVSFKNRQGQWTGAKNLGPLVNSRRLDYSPWLTRDKKYLFFSSERLQMPADIGENYTLEYLENLGLQAGNGQGDIYVLPWQRVLQSLK